MNAAFTLSPEQEAAAEMALELIAITNQISSVAEANVKPGHITYLTKAEMAHRAKDAEARLSKLARQFRTRAIQP